MTLRYTALLALLFATSAAAQPIPDTLRAPAEADSITVFGWTVDADADRLLVGARVWPPPYPRSQNLGADATQRADHHGTVFVYRRQPGGEWAVEGRLKADYISQEDCFGWSLDLRGELAAVGAECEGSENPDGTFRSGAVYLFRYDGTAWVREAKIYPSEVSGPLSPTSYFGESVSLEDERLVVGTVYVANPDNPDEDWDSGAAHVFELMDGEWTHTATLVNEDTGTVLRERFGIAVLAVGDEVLVGATGEGPEISRRGAVYVFSLEEEGWVQQEKLLAPVPESGEEFGLFTAAGGGGAAVGAEAAVYPLARSSEGWSVGPKLEVGPSLIAVARYGDRVLSAAWGTQEASESHLFTDTGAGWADIPFSTPPFKATRDELVSLTNQHAFVGVPTFEGGQVLVYDLGQLVADEPDAAALAALVLSVAPNPVSGEAVVRFELPQAGTVRLTVYDVLGREVARLVEGARPAGAQAVGVDAGGLAPGVYVLRLQTEGRAVTQRFTVVR